MKRMFAPATWSAAKLCPTVILSCATVHLDSRTARATGVDIGTATTTEARAMIHKR